MGWRWRWRLICLLVRCNAETAKTGADSSSSSFSSSFPARIDRWRPLHVTRFGREARPLRSHSTPARLSGPLRRQEGHKRWGSSSSGGTDSSVDCGGLVAWPRLAPAGAPPSRPTTTTTKHKTQHAIPASPPTTRQRYIRIGWSSPFCLWPVDIILVTSPLSTRLDNLNLNLDSPR